jgi:hypothetical protein
LANSKLIALLDDMVGDLDKYPLTSYPERLQQIAAEVPHAIVPLESADDPYSYNCVMHALDMVGKMEEFSELGGAAVPTAFAQHLVETGELQPSEPAAGVLVTWRTDKKPLAHIGKLIGLGRAASKWGAGLLGEHALTEVPSSYGDVSGYYHPFDAEKPLDLLRAYFAAAASAAP